MTPGRPRFDRRRAAAIVVIVGAMTASACTSSGDTGQPSDPAGSSDDDGVATEETRLQAAGLEEIELDVRPGPYQLAVDRLPDGLDPAASVEAVGSNGQPLAEPAVFNADGTALVRGLEPGSVELRVTDGATEYRAGPYEVQGEEPPDAAIYGETTLEAGYNYIPTRDGTTLSAFVSLPGPAENGPYPTLVEYSGYSPSNPAEQADQYRTLVPALGYALVQVNVRGTGCSGGSFDAFERIQSLDGYDVIETVATQSWSAKVGMFGVSYPAIMQLHVASTGPPSLAAIAPLSVTDRVESVLYPGGIYNDGFGETWSRQVSERATAAGQPWAAGRIERGDEVCETNQRFRSHNPDLVEVVRNSPYTGELSIERSAETHAADIDVPVFIAGAWQDEQTGGRFPALLDELSEAPVLRAVLYNGLHVDAVSGEMLVRLIAFYNLYVGDRSPTLDPLTATVIGLGLSAIFGDGLVLPESPYVGMSVEEARTAFEAEDPIVVLFDQGATRPNLPVPSFEATFGQWPPAGSQPLTLFLDRPEGAGPADELRLEAVASPGEIAATFETRPEEGDVTTIDDLDTIWTDEPDWDWPAPTAGAAVVASTPVLTEDLVLVGNLSADLWVSAEGEDADLEVTVSEVAPDGSETYVQSGWLRLSRRALADDATPLRPNISGLEDDVAPVAPGEPVLARVEVLPFAHVFRAGSRLRITIDTPGASKPQWRFDVAPDPAVVTIHSTPEQPSQVVLPNVPGIDVPTERPACGVLRGQPCRPAP